MTSLQQVLPLRKVITPEWLNSMAPLWALGHFSPPDETVPHPEIYLLNYCGGNNPRILFTYYLDDNEPISDFVAVDAFLNFLITNNCTTGQFNANIGTLKVSDLGVEDEEERACDIGNI
jgi:hypothetical protein